MAGTNFPNGVYSKGVPLLGSQGFMTRGNSFFVDPANGDDGGPGDRIDKPYKTLTKAYSMCTANQNDVVYIIGGATGVSLSEAFVWAKDNTHLIGISGGAWYGQRSRIGHSDDFTPVVTFSAKDCLIKNINFLTGRGDAANLIGVLVSGSRNVFEGCSFSPMLHQTEADTAGSIGLSITSAQNHFKDCFFGNDTIDRGAANCLIKLTGASKVLFDNCIFLQRVDETTPVIVDATGALGFINLFRDCQFISASVNYGTTAGAAFKGANSDSTRILLVNPVVLGFTDIQSSDTGAIYVNPATATADDIGTAVAVLKH